MMSRSLAVLGLLLVLIVNSLLQPRSLRAATASCVMTRSDEQWVRESLANWSRVRHHYLKARSRSLPTLILFDDQCSYTYQSTLSVSRPRSITHVHGGRIVIPNGPTFPTSPQASFNSISTGNEFLLMSLPSVWRTVAPPSEIPIERFLEGVFFHELAHSLQAQVTPSAWLLTLQQSGYSPEKLSDDAVQTKFAMSYPYATGYARERDLLYRAAAAPTSIEAQGLVCRALAALRSRRVRYFAGADADYARVDELSLTSEGLAQWVAFTWLTKGRNLPAALVLSKLRGPFWSQDEGLAIFLVIDRLVPNWQVSLFGKSPVTAEGQLAKACKGHARRQH